MMQPPKPTAGGAVCMAGSHWERLATLVNLLQAGASLGSHRDAETLAASFHHQCGEKERTAGPGADLASDRRFGFVHQQPKLPCSCSSPI